MGALRFAGEWSIPADADQVYEALAHFESYPDWWPGLAVAQVVVGRSGQIRLHTWPPANVIVNVVQRTADPGGRVLVMRFSGGVEGVGRWEVKQVGGGARARYDEHLAVRTPLARRAGWFALPAIYAGHAHLMKVGEQALTRYLGAMQSR